MSEKISLDSSDFVSFPTFLYCSCKDKDIP